MQHVLCASCVAGGGFAQFMCIATIDRSWDATLPRRNAGTVGTVIID